MFIIKYLRVHVYYILYLYVAQTGWRTYRRPDEKSGGHGVGWSPIIPYSFAVPDGWEEVDFTKNTNIMFIKRSS